jgi:DNA repair photolyase
MSLYYVNLDERTRLLMQDEVEYDIARNQLHISPLLSGQGQRDYENLLQEAIQHGTDETFAQELRAHRRITRTLPRRKPKGGFAIAATPNNAADILAESEFNRFYIRALARRAIEDGIPNLVVYRAKPVENPRPESEALVESTLSPEEVLNDLRAHPDEPPRLGVPSGPNSGLSVRLP